jgi:hypothetical protein
LIAILGSTTGGVTTESGCGVVSGCFTMPGSRGLGDTSGFGDSDDGGAGVPGRAGLISAARQTDMKDITEAAIMRLRKLVFFIMPTCYRFPICIDH